MSAAATRTPTLGHAKRREFPALIMINRQLKSSSNLGLIQLVSRFPRVFSDGDRGAAAGNWSVVTHSTMAVKTIAVLGVSPKWAIRTQKSTFRPTCGLPSNGPRGFGMGRCNRWRSHGWKDIW